MRVSRSKFGKRFSSVELADATQMRLSASKRGDSATIRIACEADTTRGGFQYAFELRDDSEILQLHAWLNRYVRMIPGLNGHSSPVVAWQ